MGRRRSTRSSWTAAWAFMAERYFEPAEVERLIPTLTRLMAGVMRANEEATTIAGRLEAERERIGLAGGGVIDRAAWKADTDRVVRLIETVKAGLGQIAVMGGTIKDLALGLVDFPHRRGGGVVNLCWDDGATAGGPIHRPVTRLRQRR